MTNNLVFVLSTGTTPLRISVHRTFVDFAGDAIYAFLQLRPERFATKWWFTADEKSPGQWFLVDLWASCLSFGWIVE